MDYNYINLLDINISLYKENLVTKVFDKRNNFNLKTLKLLHFDSCVHISVKRNIFRNDSYRKAVFKDRRCI